MGCLWKAQADLVLDYDPWLITLGLDLYFSFSFSHFCVVFFFFGWVVLILVFVSNIRLTYM